MSDELTLGELEAAHVVAVCLLEVVLEDTVEHYNVSRAAVVYALHLRLMSLMAESGLVAAVPGDGISH